MILKLPCNRLILALVLSFTCLFGSAVSAATVAKIVLTVPSKTLKISHKETLKATAKDAAGHTITGVKFTWTSSKSTVVKVGSTGIITALKAGTSTIKAAGGGKSASVIITVPTPTSVSGVAAHGAAIAGATITLKDKSGHMLTTTTASDGSYSLDTTGLTSPFMVSVQIDPSTILYSVSDATAVTKVINVTPLTDLIIRSWYSVQGKDVVTAFANPVSNPPPSPTEVQLISNVVVQVTALWLQQNGVDTTSFSPISTPFTADGTGVDAVLDQTTVDTGAGTVTITDGTTTQDSTVTSGGNTISVDTTITGTDGSSSSTTGTVVATTTTMQAALTGITTTLTNFSNTVSTKGSALKASDLTPYLDAGMVNEGLTKTEFADATADDFRGHTLSLQLLNIASLDTVGGVADVNFTATIDSVQTQTVEFFFKKQSDGTWRLYGDQHPAHFSVHSEMRTNQGANAAANGPVINVDIRPRKDAYTGITVDDNGVGVFTNTALTKQSQTEINTYTPDPAAPGTTVEIDRDVYYVESGVLASLVPAGTPINITMTPTGGGADQHFTVDTNAFTTEAISITNLTGSALTDAALDGTLHVVWTLPKTFAIAEVKLSATVETTNFECQVDGPSLSITDTSGDISLPSMCNGESVTTVNLNLKVVGVNGEQDFVIYQFQ